MVKIPLKNKTGDIVDFALIDESYFELLSNYKWYLSKNGYAVSGIYDSSTKKTFKIYMHRLIVNCPAGFEIDHINQNKLDNTCSNLRVVTHSHNIFNTKKRFHGKNLHKGVCYDTSRKKWFAQLTINKKRILFKRFNTEEEALIAYNSLAKSVMDGDYFV